MLAKLVNLIAPETVQELTSILEQATYAQGKKTAGYRAERVKANLQLDFNSDSYKQASKLIYDALADSRTFRDIAFPKRIGTVLFSRYLPGMEYGLHADSGVMYQPNPVRTDISMTIFLSPIADYDGGELVLQTPYGEQHTRLDAGDAVIYPSQFLHRVAPVTRGQRLAAVTWVQSVLREPAQREIMMDLDRVQQILHQCAPDDIGTDLVGKISTNLMRRWSDL